MHTLMIWLKVVRWKNLSIILLLGLFTRFILFEPVYHEAGIRQALPLSAFLILLISLILLGAGGYLINAVMDIRIDLHNKPDEVLIGKPIDPHKAMQVYYVLTAGGILLGIAAALMSGSFKLAGLHVIAAGLFWSYSQRYKKIFLLGNTVVSLLSAMLIPVLWIFEFFALREEALKFAGIVPRLEYLNTLVISLFIFAFLISFLREIVKDVEDMEGDQRYGCQSLPLRTGIKTTSRIILILTLIISILIWFGLPRTMGKAGLINQVYVLAVVIFPLLYVGTSLFKNPEKQHFTRASRILKFCMLSGTLAYVFLMFH